MTARPAPPIKPRWRHMRGAWVVEPMTPRMREWLYNANPECPHEWALIKWSGYECNNCDGWHCA